MGMQPNQGEFTLILHGLLIVGISSSRNNIYTLHVVGMLDMVLPLSEQPPYGQWKIQVRFYVRTLIGLLYFQLDYNSVVTAQL
jgi:hypothetical protein